MEPAWRAHRPRFRALVQADLADRLQKRQRLDVANGAAHLDDADIGVARAQEYRALDLVGYVRNDLHGRAQVAATALAGDDGVVDAPGGEIRIAPRLAAAHEALVVSQVEVRFRTVGGYEHLAMLKGAHGARIHVQVGIQFDHADAQAAGFENCAQRGGGDSLSQRGNYAACNENVAGHATPITLWDRASTISQTALLGARVSPMSFPLLPGTSEAGCRRRAHRDVLAGVSRKQGE